MRTGSNAVIVLSGGMDSATCLGWAHHRGYSLFALTFDYGQRHVREVDHAKRLARFYKVRQHRIVSMDFFRRLGASALTDKTIAVPDGARTERGVPMTYVPGRNMIFLSVAAAWAEVVRAGTVVIGVSAVDYSGYPDCRPSFIRSMNETIRLATRAGASGKKIRVVAPLVHLSKKETVILGTKLGVPYELTTSCYRGQREACGTCASCRLRLRGFAEAGMTDPVSYKIRRRNP